MVKCCYLSPPFYFFKIYEIDFDSALFKRLFLKVVGSGSWKQSQDFFVCDWSSTCSAEKSKETTTKKKEGLLHICTCSVLCAYLGAAGNAAFKYFNSRKIYVVYAEVEGKGRRTT